MPADILSLLRFRVQSYVLGNGDLSPQDAQTLLQLVETLTAENAKQEATIRDQKRKITALWDASPIYDVGFTRDE